MKKRMWGRIGPVLLAGLVGLSAIIGFGWDQLWPPICPEGPAGQCEWPPVEVASLGLRGSGGANEAAL